MPQEYYGKLDCWHRNPLKNLHDFYTSHFQRGANLKVLNYGCGPIVAFEASAVPYAQEIVLAEYAEQNRAVAKLRLDKDPSRPDFSALYRYVVEELEGQGAGEVEERQDAKGYEGPYDVVYSGACIEDACYTIEVFGAALSKLCDLLKPGGCLVMSVCTGTEAGVHPSIAAWKLSQLSLSRGGLGLRSLSHHAPAAFIASLRDISAETCRRAHFSVQVEAGCNLTPDHSHSRPADVLISNWALGKMAACDISVTSPLNSNIMSEAGVTAGAAAQATELRKHEANDVKCSEGYGVVFESSLSPSHNIIKAQVYGRLTSVKVDVKTWGGITDSQEAASSAKNLEAFALFSAMDLAQKIGSPIGTPKISKFSAFDFIPSGKPTPISMYPWQRTIRDDHHNTQMPIERAQKVRLAFIEESLARFRRCVTHNLLNPIWTGNTQLAFADQTSQYVSYSDWTNIWWGASIQYMLNIVAFGKDLKMAKILKSHGRIGGLSAMTVVVLKVVVVEAVGLVKRAAVMWMVMSAAAKLEALLAAAEDKQMLILMSSALKSEMRIFVVVIAVKMIEVMQIIFGADPHGPVEEEQITPKEIPPVKDAAVVSTEDQPSEPEVMEPLPQAPPRSPIIKHSRTGTAIRPPLRF
eukprot:Em0014g202a